MKKKINNTKKSLAPKVGKKKGDGYPLYPASEDIYRNNKEETELDPEDPRKVKTPTEKPDQLNEKNFVDDLSGGDLDIPGAELDDEQENIGSEDEENNYYSIGGDNHENLEEDKGG
jgi:hypothetical protein